MMRKVVCLLLALVLCLSLPCTAMAAVISPGQDGTAPNVPDDGVPDTGDHSSVRLWLLVMLLALLVLVLVVIFYRKYMKQ